MAVLAVAPPSLSYQETLVGHAPLDGLITIACSGATLPDGSAFTVRHLGGAGAYVYRRVSAGSPVEVFDGATQWKPDNGTVPPFVPQALGFKQGAWEGQLAPAGFDQAFQGAETGFPQYFVRIVFTTGAGAQTVTGLSAPSAAFPLASQLDAMRAGLGMGKGEKPTNANQVQMFLRTALLGELGHVRISAIDPLAEIEIATFTGAGGIKATVRLAPDGSIRLTPATGQKVIIVGSLEVTESISVAGTPLTVP